MRFLFPMLMAVCTTIGAAVPTSNLCEDQTMRFNDFSPSSAWRLDTTYFVETSPSATSNDWSWKYQYSATTGFPTSLTVDFFEGEGPKTHPFIPMDGGFYVQSSESGIEYDVYQTKADTFVHTVWTTKSDTIVDSTRVSTWEHGRFGLRHQQGFVDTIKSFWSGDTFFDMRLYSQARNTATSKYIPSIDTCFTLTKDQCACHTGFYSELIVRAAWNDGFKISTSYLDSSSGNYRTTRIYRPLPALTEVKRRGKANLRVRPAEEFRWNGSRPREAATSTNPIDLLRQGLIPANTEGR
jgi:hypothetical protein